MLPTPSSLLQADRTVVLRAQHSYQNAQHISCQVCILIWHVIITGAPSLHAWVSSHVSQQRLISTFPCVMWHMSMLVVEIVMYKL